MQAVIDVNVLVSGLFWQGTLHALIERVRDGTLHLVSSPNLLAELAEAPERPRFADVLKRSGTPPDRVLTQTQTLAEVIAPPPLPAPLCRDPDNDEVVALAVAAQVDLIVSGDADLRDLETHQGIPIVTPAQALRRIDERN